MSAIRLAQREPGLAARLVGFNSDPIGGGLITQDTAGRFWLWRWQRSPFVAPDPINRRVGQLLADTVLDGVRWLWVPMFGPFEIARRAAFADVMMWALQELGAAPVPREPVALRVEAAE